MSYILDALKKIEREKIKKSAPGGITTLSGDLFHERTPQQASRSAGKIVVLVVMVSLLTFAASWFLLKGDSKNSQTAKKTASMPAAMPAPVAVQPAPSAPPLQPVPTVLPVPQPTSAPLPTAAAIVPPPAPAAPAALLPAAGGKPPKTVRKPAAASVPPRPMATVQAPADIKLSGIAWQEERAGRRAVINDFLLHEGSVVAGGTVTEILADRVRFSSAAGVYEVRLNSVQPVEQKR